MEKKFGALSSSVDGNKLASTVKGAIVLCSGLVIVLAQYLGLPLTETNVVELASQAGIATGALWTIYGLLQKAVVKIVK